MLAVRWAILCAALLLSSGSGAAAAPTVPATAGSAAAAASSPRFANLPLQREESASTAGLPLAVQMLLAVALIAGLAAVYKLRARKVMGGGTAGALHAAQALRLTQGASLHVVRWGDEELLLGSTASGVSLLSRRTTAPAAGAPSQGGAA